MPYSRRFLHYSTPTTLVGVLEDRVVDGAWFELHRQGGCGEGEIVLRDGASSGETVDINDWIAFEYDTGDRWYFGQVQDRRAFGHDAEKLKLVGMGAQLEEVFPGGFGSAVADGTPPHRYAQTDLFSFDPDYSDESIDTISQPAEVVRLLAQQYVAPLSDITYDANLVDDPTNSAAVRSLKVRGEESVAAILRDLAVRAGGFSWGVNADGKLFFLAPQTTLLATFQEAVDLVELTQVRRRDLIFNRLLLTGGSIYSDECCSDSLSRGLQRWRGVYIQPDSRGDYGDRPLEITLPWIRTPNDSRAFAREFFRTYANEQSAFLVEVAEQSSLLQPWDGRLRLKDAAGNETYLGGFESVRVQFDHSPRFRMHLGPADPRDVWPQPAVDDRWPVGGNLAGDELSLTSFSSGSGGGSGTSFAESGA